MSSGIAVGGETQVYMSFKGEVFAECLLRKENKVTEHAHCPGHMLLTVKCGSNYTVFGSCFTHREMQIKYHSVWVMDHVSLTVKCGSNRTVSGSCFTHREMWIKSHSVRVMFVGSIGPHDGVVEVVVSMVLPIALKGMADEGSFRSRHQRSDRQPVRPESISRDCRGDHCGVLEHLIGNTSCPHTVEVLVSPAVPIQNVVPETVTPGESVA